MTRLPPILAAATLAVSSAAMAVPAAAADASAVEGGKARACASQEEYYALELGMHKPRVQRIIGGPGRLVWKHDGVQLRRYPICHAPAAGVRLKYEKHRTGWVLVHKYARAE